MEGRYGWLSDLSYFVDETICWLVSQDESRSSGCRSTQQMTREALDSEKISFVPKRTGPIAWNKEDSAADCRKILFPVTAIERC